ncbi:MAG: outer membrane protein assembly factor BamD [Deltaproteobacteria bacterium]|nr:outer membrane protein assembly factor BamD [Deltaproteobacteria bacterium]
MNRPHYRIRSLRGLSARCLVLLSLLIIGIFPGCAGKDKGIEAGKDEGVFSGFRSAAGPSKSENEVDLSDKAMDYFGQGRYILAEEIFQKVRDRYPFSPYATLAELRLADCKFHMGNYDEAIPLYEEFQKLHPTNEAVIYVIFQEGSCYYRLMEGPDREQTSTHKLIETYERLLNRYPDSPYSYEARKRIAEAKNRLAQHEILVAQWYIRTEQVPQAKNRLEIAMDRYPNTSAGVKAAHLLKEERILQQTSTTETDRVKESEESWWRRLIPFI